MRKKILNLTGLLFGMAFGFCLLNGQAEAAVIGEEEVFVGAGVAATLEEKQTENAQVSIAGISKSAVKVEAVTQESPVEEVTQTTIAGYTNLGVANVDSYLNVRTENNEGSKLAGKMPKNAGCEITEVLDGWYKIQSGEVSGYVKSEYLLTGEAAVAKAQELLTDTATAKTSNLNVRKEPNTESSVIIQVGEGEKLEVVEVLDGWVKVAVDSDAGYVAADYVAVGKELPTAVTLKELYYGNGVSQTRVEMVEYAKQFLGNPYVWGGTSLTKGTDCSGFTMGIYKHFGISLPHSSRAQAGYGTKVSLSDAKPGDLVFYSSGGSINHVAMYIGNGQVIHASTKKTGIKISNVSYRSVKTVRRIINE